jgi:hypothetical protein
MGNAVKAVGFDENTCILEVNMAGCSKKKIVEACKRPMFRFVIRIVGEGCAIRAM